MKTRLSTRIVSITMAILFVILLLPVGAVSVSAADNQYVTDDAGYIGYGYNVMNGTSISENGAIDIGYPILDNSKLTPFIKIVNINYSGSDSIRESSEYKFSRKYSSKFSTKVEASVPISVVSVKASVKFDTSSSSSTSNEGSKLYEMYYKSIDRKNVSLQVGAIDIRKYLSSNFKEDLKELLELEVKTDDDIIKLFNRYGTHLVAEYTLGGRIEFTCYTESKNSNVNLSNESNFVSNISAKVGRISAENDTSVSASEELQDETGNSESHFKCNTIGGNSINDSDLDDALKNYGDWVDSINKNENLVITGVPSSSSLIPIWELLPDGYATLCNQMIRVYNNKCRNVYSEYCKTFYNTVKEKGFDSYLYVSGQTGYCTDIYPAPIYPAQCENANELYVAPGSILYLNPGDVISEDYDFAEFVVTSGDSLVDINGATGQVNVKNDAVGKFTVEYMCDGITVCKQEFTIKREGDEGRFAGGYGTSELPYLISTKEQLDNLNGKSDADDYINKCYMLTTDINFEGKSWIPIKNFKGTFDGNGYSIYNININTNVDDSVGFISVNTGTIKNLTFGIVNDQFPINEKYSVTVSYSATAWTRNLCIKLGVVAGQNEGTIDNCTVVNAKAYCQLTSGGGIGNGNYYCEVGGIAGVNNEGVISKCTVKNSEITACMPCKSDSGDENYSKAGGIAGRTEGSGSIYMCLSQNNTITSTANGDGWIINYSRPEAVAGGITGAIFKDSQVSTCLSLSNSVKADPSGDDYTTGSKYEGRLFGFNYGKAEYLYTDIDTSDTKLYELNDGTINELKSLPLVEIGPKISNEEWAFDDKGIPSVATIDKDRINVSIKKSCYYQATSDSKGGVSLQGLNICAKYNSESINDFNINGIGFIDVGNLKTDLIGDKVIPVTTYGGNIAYIKVTVEKVDISQVKVSDSPRSNSFYEDDEFNTDGLSLDIYYNNGDIYTMSNDEVSSLITSGDIQVSGYNTNKTGIQNVKVVYQNYSANYQIEVLKVEPVCLEVIDDTPTKINYAVGSQLDTSGIKLQLSFNNGTKEIITDIMPEYKDATIDATSYNMNEEGQYAVKITYKGQSTTFGINVGAVEKVEISKLPQKLKYYTSDKKIDTTGLELKVTYSNKVEVIVTSGFSIGDYDLSKEGTKEIVITYPVGSDNSVKYEIEIEKVSVESISVYNYPRQKYYYSDTFSSVGLQVMASYNNGSRSLLSSNDYYYIIDGYNINENPVFSTLGNKNITVYYAHDALIKTTFALSVEMNDYHLEIVQFPQTTYRPGESFNSNGMILNKVYDNGAFETLNANFDVLNGKFTKSGKQVVTLRYGGKTVDLTVTVASPLYIEVATLPNKTVYEIGETFDITGLKVNAVYFDGYEETLDNSKLTVSSIDTSKADNYSVKVTYDNLNTYFSVNVQEKEITEDDPQVIGESKNASAGKEIEIPILLKNNPGISYLTIRIAYAGEVFTYAGVANGSIVSSMTSSTSTNPLTLIWSDSSDISENGTLATLKLKVGENVAAGDYEIAISVIECNNADEDVVTVYAVPVTVSVIDFVYGDANGDGEVNGKDVTRLLKYLANYDYDTDTSTVEISAGADATGDGEINGKDVTRLLKYLANYDYDTNTSTVILGK